MEKNEKTIIDPVVDDTVVDDNTVIEPEVPAVDTYVPSVDDATLAPTDDVIPAPVEDPMNVPIDLPGEEPADDIVVPRPDACPECGDSMEGCPECPTPLVPEVSPACGSVTIGNLFGTLQDSVTIAWRFHLKTRKHHVHVDLNDFYDAALSKVDDIIEIYQGINGVVEDVFTNCVVGEGKTEVEYLQELKTFIETNRYVAGDNSELQSAIDDFLGTIDTTLYKLTSFCEHAVKSFDEFVYEDYASVKESCKYDRYGERSCDDPDDPDYDPEFENGECGAEEEE